MEGNSEYINQKIALFTISVLKEKKIDSEARKKILKAVQKDISGLMILEAQKKHVL